MGTQVHMSPLRGKGELPCGLNTHNKNQKPLEKYLTGERLGQDHNMDTAHQCKSKSIC